MISPGGQRASVCRRIKGHRAEAPRFPSGRVTHPRPCIRRPVIRGCFTLPPSFCTLRSEAWGIRKQWGRRVGVFASLGTWEGTRARPGVTWRGGAGCDLPGQGGTRGTRSRAVPAKTPAYLDQVDALVEKEFFTRGIRVDISVGNHRENETRGGCPTARFGGHRRRVSAGPGGFPSFLWQ